jgi:hypothetical protein
MEHLLAHEHALVDENNVVLNVAVFDGHNHELLEAIRVANNAAKIICCCDNGMAVVNGTWTGEHFLDVEGNRVPLTLPPDNTNIYEYNFETNEWTFVLPNLEVVLEKIKNNLGG